MASSYLTNEAETESSKCDSDFELTGRIWTSLLE